MSVETATNELADYVVIPVSITRRRARQFDTEFRDYLTMTRDDITVESGTARSLIASSLIEYVTSPIYKIKHNIGSVVIENNNTGKCECNICYEEHEKRCFVKLNCGHEFCGKCINITLENTCPPKKPRCAYCRVDMTTIEFSSQEAKSVFSDILMADETSI